MSKSMGIFNFAIAQAEAVAQAAPPMSALIATFACKGRNLLSDRRTSRTRTERGESAPFIPAPGFNEIPPESTTVLSQPSLSSHSEKKKGRTKRKAHRT